MFHVAKYYRKHYTLDIFYTFSVTCIRYNFLRFKISYKSIKNPQFYNDQTGFVRHKSTLIKNGLHRFFWAVHILETTQ